MSPALYGNLPFTAYFLFKTEVSFKAGSTVLGENVRTFAKCEDSLSNLVGRRVVYR